MNQHERYMERCIELAALALGSTYPNPLVGAVVVHEGRIIGEGYHQRYGEAHAEVNAINSVLTHFADGNELLKASTLYVSLEPCNHYGKTPPCSELIIEKQIPRVVIGSKDPFSLVNGKGIKRLLDGGVEVIQHVLEAECKDLNKRFFTYHEKQRPYVILKWAQSADGYIAPEPRQKYQISGPESARMVHKWRTQEQAILVGTTTALTDDPSLTARLWEGKNPLRLVIDKDLKIPGAAKLFNSDAETIVFNQHKTGQQDNIRWVQIDFYGQVPQFILYQLYLLGIQSLIVEGGAFTLNEFIRFGLWDEARVFTSPVTLTSGLKAPLLNDPPAECMQSGADQLNIYRNT